MEPEEKSQAIRAHITELLKDTPMADVLQAILEELFFVEVGHAFQRRGRIDSRHSTGYREAKRLTHPECFVKYFLRRVPQQELADHNIEMLIDAWNAAGENTVEERIRNALLHYKEIGHLSELLSKLALFSMRVASERVPPVVRALYKALPQFSRVGDLFSGTEYERAYRLLFQLLGSRAASSAIRPLLEEMVCEVQPLHFMVYSVWACHQPPTEEFRQIRTQIDLGVLRTLAAERLQTYFIAEDHDIFAEFPESEWPSILYQWGTSWGLQQGETRTAVQQYVMRLIERQPPVLGKLLRGFFQQDDPNAKARFRQFSQLFDLPMIKTCVERYGNAALTTPEATEAAQLFGQLTTEAEADQPLPAERGTSPP